MDINYKNIELIDKQYMLRVVVSTIVFIILYYIYKLLIDFSYIRFIELIYMTFAFGLTLIISEIGYNIVLFYL